MMRFEGVWVWENGLLVFAWKADQEAYERPKAEVCIVRDLLSYCFSGPGDLSKDICESREKDMAKGAFFEFSFLTQRLTLTLN
jgi:hypothetical protein